MTENSDFLLDIVRFIVAPGESQRLAMICRHFRGYAATGPYEMMINDNGRRIPWATGVSSEDQGLISSVEVFNPGTEVIEVDLLFSNGKTQDNRFVAEAEISGGIRLIGSRLGNFSKIDVSLTAVKLADANPMRSALLVQHLGSAPVWLFSDNTVSAANGIRIDPGVPFSIALQTELWVVAEAASQDLRLLEEVA